MFPTVHGVVSQGGVVVPPEFTPTWMATSEPGASNFSAGTAGWAFQVSRPLLATKARVFPSTSVSRTRGVRVWREDDETDLGGVASFTTEEEAWVETPLDAPVLLEPGYTYVLVVWRPGSTNMSLRTFTSLSPLETIPEVTFLGGRETSTGGGALPTTPTNNTRAVDLWLEAP